MSKVQLLPVNPNKYINKNRVQPFIDINIHIGTKAINRIMFTEVSKNGMHVAGETINLLDMSFYGRAVSTLIIIVLRP